MAALGATLKVAMDSSAVKRGVAGIRASFARLGGTLKSIGGAMRKSLVPVIGVLAGVGFAVKKVADLGSELSDMSVQTGVAVGKLVEMQEALRLAGVPMRDTSRMLSLMASNIQEARFQAGAARDALEILGGGTFVSRIAPLPMDEQFQLILETISKAKGEIPQLERAMEGIFGARMGFGILRLAKDLEGNLAQARANAESFGKFMEDNATRLDRTADAMGRLGMVMQQIMGSLVVALPLDKIADAINSIDTGALNEKLTRLVEWLQLLLTNPGEALSKVWEKLAEFAAKFADILATAIGDKLRGLLPFSKGRRASGGPSKMEQLQAEANRLLMKIERKEGASFA